MIGQQAPPVTANVTIRPAEAREADSAAAIYLGADSASAQFARELLRGPAEEPRTNEAREAAAGLRALMGTGSDAVFLAFGDEPEPVGVAAVVARGRHAHITFLFVDPVWQGQGIGRALLGRLRSHIADAGCNVTSLHASRDARALQRYLRYGLHPAPPMLTLIAPKLSSPSLDLRDGLDAVPLHADDPALLATVGDIDAVVRGVRRSDDLRAWLSAGARGALLTRHGTSVPVGYYLIESNGRRARIGPVAAIDVERVPAVLHRALAAADLPNGDAAEWRVDLPAENQAALAPLFDAGFRARQLTPYLSTGAIGRWDRYVFHDEDLL